MPKVLVVDDEVPIVDAIAYNLKREGFTVETAFDAGECMMKIHETNPDMVVLDVMLPSGSGLDICRRLQEEQAELPVLLLTARAAEDDRLRGFECGADDYLVKPFSMRELMARVHALLRRRKREADAAVGVIAPRPFLHFGNVEIAVEKREVRVDGQPMSLSRKEFDLLAFLAASRGQVFDRQTLLSRVWGEDSYVDDRTVDVHIRWLREKLESNPSRPEKISTVRGIGYKFTG